MPTMEPTIACELETGTRSCVKKWRVSAEAKTAIKAEKDPRGKICRYPLQPGIILLKLF